MEETPSRREADQLNDHDAIVTLVSEMRQLRGEVKDIKNDIKEVKDNVADRVSDLEREKLDKEDANKIQVDFETRLRTIESFKDNFLGRYVVIAFIVCCAVSAVIGLIINASLGR